MSSSVRGVKPCDSYRRKELARATMIWSIRGVKPCDSSPPTAISRSFPALVSAPTVYDPDVRCLVPVPTVSHLTLYPAVPIPSRHVHTLSPINWGSYFRTIYHQFCRFSIVYMAMDATGQSKIWVQQQRRDRQGLLVRSTDHFTFFVILSGFFCFFLPP